MPLSAMRDRLAFPAAVVGPLACSAVLALVRSHLPNTDAALILVLVVVAVASLGMRTAGYLAAVSAAVWFDFFLTVPYEHLSIDRQADVKTTILLLAIGVAVTELAVWGRRQAALASGQAAYLAGIRKAAEVVARGGSAAQLTRDIGQDLVRILRLASCRFEQGVAGLGQPARLRPDGEVEWQHKLWNVERQGLPAETDIEFVVESGGRLVGRFLMRAAPDSHPTLAERLVAVTLASQVGSAFVEKR
jgi:K+-sensing histidine kinase KdpD